MVKWFTELKPGQTVYIRKPWFDSIHKGGELHKSKVIRVSNLGYVYVKGFGIFHSNSQSANFNTFIERPSKKIEMEYKKQQEKLS